MSTAQKVLWAILVIVIFIMATWLEDPELYNPLCHEGGPAVDVNLLPPACR